MYLRTDPGRSRAIPADIGSDRRRMKALLTGLLFLLLCLNPVEDRFRCGAVLDPIDFVVMSGLGRGVPKRWNDLATLVTSCSVSSTICRSRSARLSAAPSDKAVVLLQIMPKQRPSL